MGQLRPSPGRAKQCSRPAGVVGLRCETRARRGDTCFFFVRKSLFNEKAHDYATVLGSVLANPEMMRKVSDIKPKGSRFHLFGLQ